MGNAIMVSYSLNLFPFILVPRMVSPLWIISDMIVEADITFVPLLAFESSNSPFFPSSPL